MNECIRKGYDFDLSRYESTNSQILSELRHVIVSKQLKPVNVISYERMPFASIDDKGLRITFDFNIRTREDELDLTKGTAGKLVCPEKVSVLEVKTEKSLPYWLGEILGKYGYRNQTFSKYCSHYAPMKINVVINENQHKGELKNVSKFLESIS